MDSITTKRKLNALSLFSGIGGIDLGLSEFFKTRVYCEYDRYAKAVLLSRMQDRSIPICPIFDDITKLNSRMLAPYTIEAIHGGFPCQDISCAGLGKGLGGKRSSLFFEIIRLAQEIKPQFIFLENVQAIRSRGLKTVGEQLARIGYDCRWEIISANEVGAPHLRKRWFLFANLPNTNGQ